MLCAPELVTTFEMTSPLAASTTCQCGPSSDGMYRILPSGEIARRSAPPFVLLVPQQPIGREIDSRNTLDRGNVEPAGLLHWPTTPLTFSGSCCPATSGNVGMRLTNL